MRNTIILLAALLITLLGLGLALRVKPSTKAPPQAIEPPGEPPEWWANELRRQAAYTNRFAEPPTSLSSVPDMEIRVPASKLPIQAKASFEESFKAKYKPAIERWCQIFAGHISFSADDVTPDRFVDRVGFEHDRQYVFVINGVTLSVRDAGGVATVHYLNAGKQTAKMQEIPKNAPPPITTPPVTREEILDIVKAESGRQFYPYEVRMVPTGLSGALNDGVMVDIGGDPDNPFTYNYSMVFGPDGNLIAYQRGSRARW